MFVLLLEVLVRIWLFLVLVVLEEDVTEVVVVLGTMSEVELEGAAEEVSGEGLEGDLEEVAGVVSDGVADLVSDVGLDELRRSAEDNNSLVFVFLLALFLCRFNKKSIVPLSV